MRTLRVTALILLASAWMAFAQDATNQPCGAPPNTVNELWFVDQNGESQSFCLRERLRMKPDGGQTVRAAVTGSRYCSDIDRKFEHVTNCNLTGNVRCRRKSDPPEFMITVRFRHCRQLFGRRSKVKLPLAVILAPPGGSVDGAFPSPSGAFLEP